MTGVSESSQQSSNLKDEGDIQFRLNQHFYFPDVILVRVGIYLK
ncbi:hypothetical protein ACK3F5_19605 [Photorhabdus asymbiotica UENP]